MSETVERRLSIFNVARPVGQSTVHALPIGSLTAACGAGPQRWTSKRLEWHYMPGVYEVTCERCRSIIEEKP